MENKSKIVYRIATKNKGEAKKTYEKKYFYKTFKILSDYMS